jgi:hypothetical protein
MTIAVIGKRKNNRIGHIVILENDRPVRVAGRRHEKARQCGGLGSALWWVSEAEIQVRIQIVWHGLA